MHCSFCGNPIGMMTDRADMVEDGPRVFCDILCQEAWEQQGGSGDFLDTGLDDNAFDDEEIR